MADVRTVLKAGNAGLGLYGGIQLCRLTGKRFVYAQSVTR